MENGEARLEVDQCRQLLLAAAGKLELLRKLGRGNPAGERLSQEIDALVARVRLGLIFQEAVELAITERTGAVPPECADYTFGDAQRADELVAAYYPKPG